MTRSNSSHTGDRCVEVWRHGVLCSAQAPSPTNHSQLSQLHGTSPLFWKHVSSASLTYSSTYQRNDNELLSTLLTVLYLLFFSIEFIIALKASCVYFLPHKDFCGQGTCTCVSGTVLSKQTQCPPNIIDFIADCLNCQQPQTACL